MSRHDNYPDDIRQYDNDPRSPFYDDPDEWMVAESDDLAEKWEKELLETNRIDDLDYHLDDIEVLCAERDNCDYEVVLKILAYAEISANPDKYRPEPDYEAMQWD